LIFVILVHRDLKPENILFKLEDSNCLRVVITDFGLSRSIEDERSFISMSGDIGTLGWMAPEAKVDNFGVCKKGLT
jgi:serine/threonine protein kinase